jgi:hypothetical protein
MPDLWDTYPDHVFTPPDEQPDPAPNDQEDPANEIKLKDDRGHLRLPAYVLIALVTALAAIVVLTVAVLIAPR